MNINGTKDFIYKNAANRIRTRILEIRNERKLSYRSIYEPEPKIIGKICNCDIIPDKNPYLIQDNVLYALKEKLEFKTYQDILWGTPEERTYQYPILFLLILIDLVDSSSPYTDPINKILCRYIPYARYYGYYKIIFRNDPILPYISNEKLYGIDSRELRSSIDNSFISAVNFIYTKCKHEFIKLYNAFADSHSSFKRWTYRFEEWISTDFMPMLLKYTPEDSCLGTRVLNIIESDYAKIPLLYCTASTEIKIIHDLLSASEKYISILEKIQENNPYIEI